MEIIKASDSHKSQLLGFAKENFMLTYAHLNTVENMCHYLANNFSEDAFTAEFDHPESDFYIIQATDDILGYFKINTGSAQTEDQFPNSMEIERIYVTQNLKGLGLGRQMIERIKQLANDMRLDFIWLGVWEENPKAIAFYQKMGFKKIGSHIFQLGEDAQTDLIMKLEL